MAAKCLPAFGVFAVSMRKAREGRNPQTGEKVAGAGKPCGALPPAGKALKDALAGGASPKR